MNNFVSEESVLKLCYSLCICRKKKLDAEKILEIVDKQKDKLFAFNHVGEVTTALSEIRDMKETCQEAQLFRDVVADRCTKVVCSVCSMCVQRTKLFNVECDSEGYIPMASIPNLNLLEVGLERTEECPRDAKTTYEYDGT